MMSVMPSAHPQVSDGATIDGGRPAIDDGENLISMDELLLSVREQVTLPLAVCVGLVRRLVEALVLDQAALLPH